jgi:hypothetical protein
VQRHATLKEKLKQQYICLERREIENLLTPGVISAIVRSDLGDQLQMNSFSQADYKGERLGKFIDEKVLPTKSPRKYSSSTGSGAIADKPAFCEKALKNIKTWTDLSQEAQALMEKVYEFVKSQNLAA